MNTSSQRELRDVVVGFGVVIAIVAVVAGVFGPTWTSGDETIDVRAVFGRTDGLLVGNPVHAAGVKVGEVAGLDLVEQFRALRDASVRIADATAAIVTDGIFGGKLVRVDIGGADRIIGDGGRISYTEDAVVLDDLLGLIVSRAKSAREAGAKQ